VKKYKDMSVPNIAYETIWIFSTRKNEHDIHNQLSYYKYIKILVVL